MIASRCKRLLLTSIRMYV